VVRLAISSIVVAVLLVKVPLQPLVAAAHAVGIGVWASVLVVFVMSHALAAFKWRMLADRAHDLPFWSWLRAHFSGLIGNFCLPGGAAGGDVVRAVTMVRQAGRTESVVVGSLVDRVVDCVVLAVLAAAGAVSLGKLALWPFALPALALVVVGTPAASLIVRALMRGRHSQDRIARWLAPLGFVAERPALLVATLLMSLAIQGTFVGLNFWLGRAAGIEVGFAVWLLAWPLSKLTALVPVSLAGLGVREAALIAYMAPFGAPPAAVLAVGLLWEMVLILGGLAGWLATSATSAPVQSPAPS
jgi:uncharacterized membrane protein YbhN (UPF0104 family)